MDNNELDDDDLITPLVSANSPQNSPKDSIFDLSSECGTEKCKSKKLNLNLVLFGCKLAKVPLSDF